MQRLSKSVPNVTGKTFSRKYISLGKIVTQWREIIGESMAEFAQPLKIHYRKPKRKGEPPTATLDISTSSSHASILIMQKQLILEKINYIFGEQLVTDIRFVHHQNPISKKQLAFKNVALDENEKNSLMQWLNEIEDSELKERLGRFGEAVIKDNKH